MQESAETKRPHFPERVVITAGMPYGNKRLHFGHIGGVFVYADIYARFLRDRLGPDRVLFISGTDGYGSPIVESFQNQKKSGLIEAQGSLEEFVNANHDSQKKTLSDFDISLDYFPTSSMGQAQLVHERTCSEILSKIYENGHLRKMTTKQFFDTEQGVFLNGRQVVGRCPIANCPSEKAYADECSLGHQYMPSELENPKSTLSGTAPEMRDVTNWFIDLPAFKEHLKAWSQGLLNGTKSRQLNVKTLGEFFEPPIIHVKKDQMEKLEEIQSELPSFEQLDKNTKAIRLAFRDLADREKASRVLSSHGVRYRTGKTLVPFRLTGNIEWGLPVPKLDDLEGLTWWVWPESLVAPISFTRAFLESQGESEQAWRTWWCDRDASIVQFIGEDNIYFYGIAEIALILATQNQDMDSLSVAPPTAAGHIQLPELVVNNHILFMDKKASSSGKIKPPMADELLDYYTSDQLRAHFIALGLGMRSVSFRPKPFNPNAQEKEADPVLKEGNLLCNVFNRLARSCFYSLQEYFDGHFPEGSVSADIKQDAKQVILDYELCMSQKEFQPALAKLDRYIRECSKYWTSQSRLVDEKDDQNMKRQLIIDAFYLLRVSTVLLHPIAPRGTEMIRQYLQVDESFWNWEHIFEPISYFFADASKHRFKTLEPRVDFFPKHPSQIPH